MNAAVLLLLEGLLLGLLAVGVCLIVAAFAPEQAGLGAGFVVLALGGLVLTIAAQFPGDG